MAKRANNEESEIKHMGEFIASIKNGHLPDVGARLAMTPPAWPSWQAGRG
jgi:hypothetical protein